jgi:predicted AAA+ superfamily ATPase
MTKYYLKRLIDKELLLWKDETGHKPLLLRGARQVGKSSSVRRLAERFESFIEIDFEKNRNVRDLFAGDLEVREICAKLSILLRKSIIPGKTLLFFDEIQACPNAISALRYFYEDYPELHVIAAGSLLEFALEELPSFGVGRIQSMFMYPFSFAEFMTACNEELLWNEVCMASPEKPLNRMFHERCLEYLRKFLVIGGMPAVVSKYVETNDFLATQKVLSGLINSLKADFSKYKTRVPDLQIAAAFEAVVHQNGGKFNFARVEQLNYRQVKESLHLLQMADLVVPVTHSSANGIPLGAEANRKKQKMILLDTGIFQRILGVELADLLFAKEFDAVNKGAIAEQYVGLELLKSASCYMPESLHFWSCENPKSSAEIDFLIQQGEKIIPIEVKSGTSGKMQSMHLFLDEKQTEYGIRTSLENFAVYDKIRVIPLYAIGNVKIKNQE